MSTITSIPHHDVKFDGDSLSERAAAALEEVRVQHHLSQPSVCELTFFASRDPMSEVENLRSGSRLRLTLPSGSGSLFDGEITALEYSYDAAHGRTIHVRCYDSLHRLRKRQPVRVHVQVTPSDLARQLVADLGLSVEAETDGPLSQRLIQHRQSDLELLVDVSRRFGLYLTLRGDVLHLINLGGIGESIPLQLGKTLFEVQFEGNGETAVPPVTG